MYASTVRYHPRLFYVVLLALLVLLLLLTVAGLAAPPSVLPPLANAPYGSWNGTTETGAVVNMTVTEDGGIMLDGAGIKPFMGVWTWTPESSVAGTLTCEPTDWRTEPTREYNVFWLAPTRIELSNGSFTVTLNRII